jgi:hypothetical protein
MARRGEGQAMKNDSLLFLWAKLSTIIQEASIGMPVIMYEPGDLRIETGAGRPFATVRIQRSHVGVYLLPLYYHPEILPAVLKPRKTGKGTLRFTEDADSVIDEMPALIERCRAMVGHY